jgi:hypothetical protein
MKLKKMETVECNKCLSTVLLEDLSKSQTKKAKKNGKATCKECVANEQTEIMQKPKASKKIKLKTEMEIVLKDNIMELNDQYEINKEISKIVPRSGDILVLDLHDTLLLLKDNEDYIKEMASLKKEFGLVVILSFTGRGEGTIDTEIEFIKRVGVKPDSMRASAWEDINYFIEKDVVDFGLLVFQRGPAKGWACDTLVKVFDKTIFFADDSDDHLESVKKIVLSRYLGGIYKSKENDPQGLLNWVKYITP